MTTLIASVKNVSVRTNVPAEMNAPVPTAPHKRRGKGYLVMNKYIKAISEYFKAKAYYEYKDPRTGETYQYKRKGLYKKNGRVLILVRGSDDSKE